MFNLAQSFVGFEAAVALKDFVEKYEWQVTVEDLLNKGEISEYRVQPEDFGIKSQSLIGLNVEDAQGSLALIRDALGRRKTENGQKAADMIVLNAGAALYAADVASSLKQGVEIAHDALHTGLARDKFEELVSFTVVFKQEQAQ